MLLESWELGRSDLHVTIAEAKLAIYERDPSKDENAESWATARAVLLVCGSHAEAKNLAKKMCSSVFSNKPVIRGAKNNYSANVSQDKENQPRQPRFPKASARRVRSVYW